MEIGSTYSKMDRPDGFLRISTTVGSKPKDIKRKRKHEQNEDIWTTFDAGYENFWP
jgi:hypothetical protein